MTTNQVLLGVGLILEGAVEGPVYRLGTRQPDHGVVAPYTGARVCTQPVGEEGPVDGNLLFLVRADGRLAPVTRNGPPEPQPGDTMVLLGLAGDGS